MADPNTRQGKRTPVTLKIKFKSETLEQFIERYAVDVSQGGIFIRTKEPLAVGTQMKFEFQLRDASPLIAGEGTVVWTRENDPSRPAIAPGMGVRFDRLADGSQTVLERILSEKAKQAPSRSAGNEATTKPPLFTDTPTRVAPAPVQEALGVRGKRKREDSEQTPLPKPMPFHSDAEDFDERAFEEATKVRSLEELAAQSAGLAGDLESVSDRAKTTELASSEAQALASSPAATMPPDELAARRQGARSDATTDAAEAPAEDAVPAVKPGSMIDRDSAPGLPEPPEASRPAKVLDTTPSPRPEKRPSAPPEEAARTKLGVEPAKRAESPVPRAVASEPSHPVAKRPSSAPIVIGILVAVAAAIGAVWWFVLREDIAKNNEVADQGSAGSEGSAVPQNDLGSAGSAVAQNDLGSAGSAVTDVGSAGSAAIVPSGPPVDTVIAASTGKGAIVEILGTDQKGPAPFTAKLEKDRAYTARVSAPGFQPLELEITGGQAKATAKLLAKLHIISVTSEPAGADIIIDGVNTQKITPADITLTPAQAARSRVRVTLRRPGYRQADQVLDASKFVEAGDQLTAKVDSRLSVQQVVRPPPTTTNGSGSATPTNGSGSAGETGSGSGSDATTTPSSGTTPPSGGTTTPPAGGTTTGSAATGGAGGTGGTESAEPEPSWSAPK